MSSSSLDVASMLTRTLMERRPGYDDAAVADAMYMMEALHGDGAAMSAVAIACDRMLDEKLDEVRFWMRVYRGLVGSFPAVLPPDTVVH